MELGDGYTKLVYGVNRKDEKAWQELFDSYYESLCHHAARILLDDHVAEDVVQEVFVNLWNGTAVFENEKALTVYLYRSVTNNALKYLRDRKVEDRRNLLYVEATLNSESIEWIDDEELLKKIYLAIENLPDKCRQIAKMRFIKEMKFSEIASELSISENTAKVQVHRAISKIKEQLAADSALFVLFSAYVEYFLE